MGLELESRGQRHPPTIGHLGMVHAGVTIGFDEIVKRHGGNPARVLEASGLQHAIQPMAQTSEITLSAFSSLLRAAAEETSLPTFSMEFAEAFDVRSFGAIGYLFELAPDLGTAVKDFCAAFELLQENTEIDIEVHGDLARISYSVRFGTPEMRAPDAEFSVTMLGAALRKGNGGASDVCRIFGRIRTAMRYLCSGMHWISPADSKTHISTGLSQTGCSTIFEIWARGATL